MFVVDVDFGETSAGVYHAKLLTNSIKRRLGDKDLWLSRRVSLVRVVTAHRELAGEVTAHVTRSDQFSGRTAEDELMPVMMRVYHQSEPNA